MLDGRELWIAQFDSPSGALGSPWPHLGALGNQMVDTQISDARPVIPSAAHRLGNVQLVEKLNGRHAASGMLHVTSDFSSLSNGHQVLWFLLILMMPKSC